MRRIVFFIITLIMSLCIKAQNNEEITSDKVMKAYLEETGCKVTTGNSIHLLTTGHDKFIDLFAEVRKAQHHIHMEYFNFRNDSIANTLFDLLAEKVKEGVKVRVMYDAFGNSSNSAPIKKDLEQSIRNRGIELVMFDPLKFPWINHVLHRDHRKLVIIDGKVGYTGGMNVADYYIKGLPEIGEWHDLHSRIEGEAVSYMQAIFLRMWNKVTKQNVEGPEYYPSGLYHGTSIDQDSLNCEISIVDREPCVTPRAITRAYNAAINSAQKKVQLINPYFVPTSSIKRTIKKALKRGVKVEIMIPSKSDIKFTPDAAITIAHRLQKKGADVYMFNGGFHHSKIMMIDDTYCTLGTANLNSRSLRYDYETNAFVFSHDITHQLNNLFERDCQSSTVMDDNYWKTQRSAGKKFVGWFASMLTFVL